LLVYNYKNHFFSIFLSISLIISKKILEFTFHYNQISDYFSKAKTVQKSLKVVTFLKNYFEANWLWWKNCARLFPSDHIIGANK